MVQKLEALLRRLPASHPRRQEIADQLVKRMAGYKGELSIDYHLRSLLKKGYLILHDLRLADSDYFFQIDTLVISPEYFLILEVKNISGTLVFDHYFKQLIRVSGEREEGFPDPTLQVERHRLQLKDWLAAHQFPQIPIERLVLISNPGTVIKNTLLNLDPSPFQHVIHSANLHFKVELFEKKHIEKRLNPQLLKKLSRKLLNSHTPSDPPILQHFQLSKDDILTGIHCSECLSLPMIRMNAKWVCAQCGSFSKDAHYAAIKDYQLLLGCSITNHELRSFLHLPSISVATRILKSLDLSHSGTFRNRTYQLKFED
ncbi:nuclease-related domain-containing protein [Fictibacillus enclensis]|uniref:nuclease-related domain-containing protein n=1 Tax=Fictibacillus enclensis TaxID=1017270 RepID=UPI0025A01CDA|nr:nuclease-related domain-containing protein [Fictibacillus enclensis]MDM5340302.1 nuclease-related domain-containing protein [Fictibacillus enclensis]